LLPSQMIEKGRLLVSPLMDRKREDYIMHGSADRSGKYITNHYSLQPIELWQN